MTQPVNTNEKTMKSMNIRYKTMNKLRKNYKRIMKSMKIHFKTMKKLWKDNDEISQNQWKNHGIHKYPLQNHEKIHDETTECGKFSVAARQIFHGMWQVWRATHKKYRGMWQIWRASTLILPHPVVNLARHHAKFAKSVVNLAWWPAKLATPRGKFGVWRAKLATSRGKFGAPPRQIYYTP